METAWLIVHLVITAVILYLAVIGTLKFVMMRRVNRTLKEQSAEIAAMLWFAADLPPEAPRRAQVIDIAQRAAARLGKGESGRSRSG